MADVPAAPRPQRQGHVRNCALALALALWLALVAGGCSRAAPSLAVPPAGSDQPSREPSLVLEIPWAGEFVITDARYIGPLAEGLALLPASPAAGAACTGKTIFARLETEPGLAAHFTVTGDPPCQVALAGRTARPSPEFIAAWGRLLDRQEIPSAEPPPFYVGAELRQPGPAAFGPVISYTAPPDNRGRIRRYSLAVPLPEVPKDLPVFRTSPEDPARIGDFSRSFGLREPPVVKQGVATWAAGRIGFEPATGTFWFDAPPNSEAAGPWTTPPATAAQFSAAAERWLRQRGLWPEGLTRFGVEGDPAGGKVVVVVYRTLSGLPVYALEPLRLQISAEKGVLHVRGQYLPPVEMSSYPTRSAESAWASLQAGHWLDRRDPGVFDGGGSPLPETGRLAAFEVARLELAYWEGPPDRQNGLLLPWYLFRNTEGQALYLPAVDPAFTGWP